MKRAILLIGMLLAFDVGAQSNAFTSGNDLMKHCSVFEMGASTFYDGVCSGYVVAIADAMAINTINTFRACVPLNSTWGQIARISIKYLREHPEQLHHAAHGLVAAALSEAFPCKL